ncbi:hypothetical protein ABH904_000107 [Pseudomonas frederiksbergensis]
MSGFSRYLWCPQSRHGYLHIFPILRVYISVAAVMAANGSALTAGHLEKPQVTKGFLPLSFGASPRLGMPSLRSCSVGPPRSAIRGRARLTRHPCRVAHCAEPALGLSRGGASRSTAAGELTLGLTAGAVERSEAAIFLMLASASASASAVALALALDLPPLSQRPNAGIAQGHRGKDAAVAAPGHGWPMAAGPRSNAGVEGMPSLSEAPNGGARALGYLGLFQVTRCKSETASGRDRRNGYVLQKQQAPAVNLCSSRDV